MLPAVTDHPRQRHVIYPMYAENFKASVKYSGLDLSGKGLEKLGRLDPVYVAHVCDVLDQVLS